MLTRSLYPHSKRRMFGKVAGLWLRWPLFRLGQRQLVRLPVLTLQNELANFRQHLRDLRSLHGITLPRSNQPLMVEDDLFVKGSSVDLHVHLAIPAEQAVWW